ncbi:L-threonylcarbamoyladenylate synthase [Rhodopseudomonas julia]|uniref:Threonylcarbamoyl-AMP synthase n=1 Tax=Rhodopseudomonas julia TaxID=200617 RepID=A0ABU0C6T7_9BRAD|nr:L-threonylcarbamoyladenylate synthase [Rhodopseudomonas julia]MDQ0324802.1 L-threonylcarbamoyladenylate synthase [Rhodopseudomonas julia]
MYAKRLLWQETGNDELLAEAADILKAGGLVAIPTETVYGLAADATNGEAVARIFEAKGRPRFNPLIAHVADTAMAGRCGELKGDALRLAAHFWPGPLTLVVPLVVPLAGEAAVHPLVTAGQKNIALRRPIGPTAELIARFGRPLAAPSANRSGQLSPTSADHVLEQLGDRIDAVIDAGPCTVGLESTIVAISDEAPRLLRPGGLAAEAIEELLDRRLQRLAPGAHVEAPGMLASHYAPRAALRLNAARVEAGEALLAFGEKSPENAAAAVASRNLSATGDLVEAASRLFSDLHALDESGAAVIAVAPIPSHGLGEAIADRLRRAAAPRPGLGASD